MTNKRLPVQPRKHRVSIEYCVPCDYSRQALQVAGELVRQHQHRLEELVLKTGSRGVFEVALDGQPLFSKQALDRFPSPGEVADLFTQAVAPNTIRDR